MPVMHTTVILHLYNYRGKCEIRLIMHFRAISGQFQRSRGPILSNCLSSGHITSLVSVRTDLSGLIVALETTTDDYNEHPSSVSGEDDCK